MYFSRSLIPTLREDPKDAEIASHILMTRAGMIRKQSAGLYVFLPLGLRTLRKVMDIVRDEMNRAGALELLPPFVTTAELWAESGRLQVMGKEMARLNDRHDNPLVLSPTNEEAFTAVVRENVHSYRDLPLNLYQINTKFRDEIRPRFGIMRCREFIMKDAYSFDTDEAGLNANYESMRAAYRRIFKRCGLEVDPVQADTGNMGGSASEEFMVPSTVGEEEIVKCPKCGYVANVERAFAHNDYKRKDEPMGAIESVSTPAVRTIEELTAFFKTTPQVFIKSIVYVADGKPVMALIRGEMEINEVKLKNLLGAAELELASEEKVKEVTNAPVGFAGPVGITGVKIVADVSVSYIVNGITGANKKDLHFKNVNSERDYKWEIIGDIRLVRGSDPCPHCEEPMDIYRGIEVGHIFKLGYKYTKAMNVTFLDKDGAEKNPIMGCYGIGIGRTMASVIEQSHDENGIVWPITIAPYHILITPVNAQDEILMAKARELHDSLSQKYEVLLDDRDERAGVKFKDADLIGIPIRITVGKSWTEEGKLEVKLRRGGDKMLVAPEELDAKIAELYRTEMQRFENK